jgi:two-component sensor histidine kinase
VFEVPDTRADPRTADNPLVTGPPHFRYYAGAPIVTPDGLALGTLCVLDYRPRALSALQRRTLAVLARQVMAQIELRQALEHKALMMQEMDHRVKNSLSLVSGLLHLQARRARTPELRAEVESARDRVMAVATLHEQLHHASRLDEVDMGAFLERLLESLRGTAGERVELASEIAPVAMDAGRASMVGVLVNEMVTNALRHAFPGSRRGRVLVRLSGDGNGAGYRLEIEDDGVGLPEPGDAAPGLGSVLIERLAGQMRADLVRQRLAPGTRVTLTVAADERFAAEAG